MFLLYGIKVIWQEFSSSNHIGEIFTHMSDTLRSVIKIVQQILSALNNVGMV